MYCHFLSFFAQKTLEKQILDKQLQWAAPKRWSKYTTHTCLFLWLAIIYIKICFYRNGPRTYIRPDPDVRTNQSSQQVRNYLYLNALRYEPESLRTESNSASVLSDIKAQISSNVDTKQWKMLVIENVSFFCSVTSFPTIVRNRCHQFLSISY